jgi:hypothetical protein
VSEIVEDKKGNIWFACLSCDLPKPVIQGGICRYDGKIFTKYPNLEGLSKNDIYSVYGDKKEIFGLVRLVLEFISTMENPSNFTKEQTVWI